MSGERPAAGRRSLPRRRRRLAGWLAIVLTLAVASPPPAFAHLRTGTIAVDYRASLATPVTGAYTAEITQADHTLRLSISAEHVVIVLGYLGEPMIRLDRDGTWVNATSPTALAAGVLARRQLSPQAGERWILHSHARAVTWRDSRAQQLPAGVRRSPWTIPILVDGHRSALRGQLRRYPAPALVVWGLLLAGLLGFGLWLVLLRRLEITRAAAFGCAALGAVVCPVLALGFALDGDASPGTWIEGFNEIVFVAVGLAVLVRGRQGVRAGAAVGLGLVSLAVALLDSPVFLHPVVLSLLPGALTRLLVVIAAGAGLVAIGLGGLGFADLLRAGLEDMTAGPNRAYS
jgi:hypothetical protein